MVSEYLFWYLRGGDICQGPDLEAYSDNFHPRQVEGHNAFFNAFRFYQPEGAWKSEESFDPFELDGLSFSGSNYRRHFQASVGSYRIAFPIKLYRHVLFSFWCYLMLMM